MKIANKRIVAFFETLYWSNATYELRQFANLTEREKEVILAEVFKRCFKNYWNRSDRQSIFSKTAAAAISTENNEDQKEIKNTFTVKLKDSEISFSADLGFDFDYYRNTFTVDIVSTVAESKEDTDFYLKALEGELDSIKNQMEVTYYPDLFLSSFFATLHTHGLSCLRSSEAVFMHTIYKNALKHFPQFKELPRGDQMYVMYKAMKKAVTAKQSNRDIYHYSKVTFETLNSEKLTKHVIMSNHLGGGMRDFYLTYERRMDRRNPEKSSEIWEKDCLIFATYAYTVGNGVTLQESFHPLEFWTLLRGPGLHEAEAV